MALNELVPILSFSTYLLLLKVKLANLPCGLRKKSTLQLRIRNTEDKKGAKSGSDSIGH